mgnify:FL=1
MFKRHCRVHGHPSNVGGLQATHLLSDLEVLSKVRAPLQRNLDIVSSCEVVIAAPHESIEQRSGGTWYAIRAARHRRRPLYLLWPNGEVNEENMI